MSAEPSFVLGGPTGAVFGDGIVAGYRDVAAAAAALSIDGIISESAPASRIASMSQ